jgi:hypothetical protein
MCLLALRQDIPRKRNLSNDLDDFTNPPLPPETPGSPPTNPLRAVKKRPLQVDYCFTELCADNTVLERQAGTYLHSTIIVRSAQPVKGARWHRCNAS